MSVSDDWQIQSPQMTRARPHATTASTTNPPRLMIYPIVVGNIYLMTHISLKFDGLPKYWSFAQ